MVNGIIIATMLTLIGDNGDGDQVPAPPQPPSHPAQISMKAADWAREDSRSLGALMWEWHSHKRYLDAVLAVAAAEKLSGDPPWLLIISGPGNAKTETVQAVSGLDARVISTITSEGALLSASPRKSRAKTATGGLLRQIGRRGILAIKDFT